ncbi:MAG: amino acid adenylation domain-containing protein [Myxococcota bacterium]|nr:amino acid adenylation domain-containing protein [Myxococcota bacterium]
MSTDRHNMPPPTTEPNSIPSPESAEFESRGPTASPMPVPSEWNGRSSSYPRDSDVATCFEQQADRSPTATALWAATRIPYSELEAWANRIANGLLSHGIGTGDFVGICLERSPEMLAGILGILKTGAAYVPLDPSFPDARLAQILQQAHLETILTNQAGSGRCQTLHGALPPGVRLECFSVDPGSSWLRDVSAGRPLVDRRPLDIAYVMYTSGSTGEPKGVCIPHRAILRLVENNDFAQWGVEERILCFAPMGFDASTFEIWSALLHGAQLHLFPSGIQSLQDLSAFLATRKITTAWLTAALFHEMADYFPDALAGVRQLLAGGDVLSPKRVRRVLEAMPPGSRLINGYGPTENTTFTCCHVLQPGDEVGDSVPIGRPIANSWIRVLDEHMNPVAVGEAGELYAGGDGLATGYLNQPKRTDESFVTDPFSDHPQARCYRTGDLVRWRPDGLLEFIGRVDGQIKVRGYRIEPGEIESSISSHPQVRDVAVIAPLRGESRKLIAYITGPLQGHPPSQEELRDFLNARLPHFMLPDEWVILERMPMNPNGKIDRGALPAQRAETSHRGGASGHSLESQMTNLWAEILDRDGLASTDSFFDLGANSLLALRFVEEMKRRHGIEIPPIRVFQHSTALDLAEWVKQGSRSGRTRRNGRQDNSALERIAIVGMAGRFPGAADVPSFWRNLCEARESISFFETDELDPGNDPRETTADHYVAARGILEDGDCFDAEFFGVSPRLAQVMDPQQRVFLETAWSALEDACIDPSRCENLIGIFGGVVHNTYQPNFLWKRPDLSESVGTLQARLVNDKDYAPISVAHKLDLKGPAVNVQSACSTSLVAISQAFHALRAGQCDIALAGGVAVTAPIRSGHLHLEGGMQSVDGHTRPFDADATGTVFSDGAGMVVLKRLTDAVEDGDTIHAVIRSAAVNNDGADKASFTAPSIEGQASVIAMALEQADLSAEDISYVEAHGTGTPLGDPIEVAGLTQAFRESTERTQFCALGSVKSNVGHLTAAAGVAGVIKTALALRHQKIPASLHFESSNPEIDFEKTPFFVSQQTMHWTNTHNAPRRAGVSSFGVGGTNAHVILEEYWDQPRCEPTRRPAHLLLVSGQNPDRCQTLESKLAQYLQSESAEGLGDVAWSLAIGRKPLSHRSFFVAPDHNSAAELLRGDGPGPRVRRSEAPQRPPGVVFLFPGQGCQSPHMGRGLYAVEPLYRQALDACAAILQEHCGLNLIRLLHPELGQETAAAKTLQKTAFTQPAIFSIEYALARLWMGLGITPTAMIGHSVGEFTAACLAGVMSLEEALVLVAERGRLMESMPAGSMLSARMGAEELKAILPDGLSLACENSPILSVVSGPSSQIDALSVELESLGVVNQILHTSHAFHSAMMDPIIEPFRKQVARKSLNAPTLPIISTATGRALSPDEAQDPNYWARHARSPVRFADALRTAREVAPDQVFLEVGPRNTTSTFARQTGGPELGQRVVSTLEAAGDLEQEPSSFLNAVGRLWTLGVDLDWEIFFAAQEKRRVSLPTYPFQRKRHWIEINAASQSATRPIQRVDSTESSVTVLIENQLDLIEQQLALLKKT